jgi:hypothetical protein
MLVRPEKLTFGVLCGAAGEVQIGHKPFWREDQYVRGDMAGDR